jgi:hypothetical protein
MPRKAIARKAATWRKTLWIVLRDLRAKRATNTFRADPNS